MSTVLKSARDPQEDTKLAAKRESLVATHLSFPCHVAVDGDVFRVVPGPGEY